MTQQQQKGDRNEVGNRQALGVHDRFLPDGGAHRTFEPLWWRVWRYLDLDIQTAGEPLTLDSLQAEFTAYPFEERASFESKDPELAQIWEISWRTAQLDAHETYMDTPYWEQLQYVGDTRIQALISYAVTGDDRLAKQALRSFDDSRIPAGLTQSRYPTSQPQIIPTFSLIWIDMLHDYWMYRPDPRRRRLDCRARERCSIGSSNTSSRTVCCASCRGGVLSTGYRAASCPPTTNTGNRARPRCDYLGALVDAADLELALGDQDRAARESHRAQHVRSGLYEKCWDAGRKLLADNPAHNAFSQQTNVLGVLLDVIPRAEQQGVLRQVMGIAPGTTAGGILSSSYYFRFYLARALDHCRDGGSVSRQPEAVARPVTAAFQYLAGDAGPDAV